MKIFSEHGWFKDTLRGLGGRNSEDLGTRCVDVLTWCAHKLVNHEAANAWLSEADAKARASSTLRHQLADSSGRAPIKECYERVAHEQLIQALHEQAEWPFISGKGCEDRCI